MDNFVLYALAALEVTAVGVVLFLTLYLLALIFRWPKKTKKFGVMGATVFFLISAVLAVGIFSQDWSIPDCRNDSGDLIKENPGCQF